MLGEIWCQYNMHSVAFFHTLKLLLLMYFNQINMAHQKFIFVLFTTKALLLSSNHRTIEIWTVVVTFISYQISEYFLKTVRNIVGDKLLKQAASRYQMQVNNISTSLHNEALRQTQATILYQPWDLQNHNN
ncbi:hypothetical protein ACJX0J_019340 [Zea mays]